MSTKRHKKNCGGMVEKENEPNTAADDRLSQLPDSLIHHIFSFLPTIYIVRMSIVSKHWKQMWVSAPFIYFDDFRKKKKVKNRDKFLNFVSKCLRYRKLYKKVAETSITRFQFHTTYSFKHAASSRLKGWLNFVIQRNVEELDLNVRSYCLPQFILNASSLTVLKLSELNLEDLSLSNFPCLKVLTFNYVKPDAKSLQNVISSCPVIEDLQVHSRSWMDPVEFAVSKTLKYLSLCELKFTLQWLEGLISGLPLLERLALKYCDDARNISIHSHSLKSLCYYGRLNNISIHSNSLKVLSITVLAEFTDSFSFEGTFVTPNLVCLCLVCGAKSVISFEAPNLLEADLTLNEDNSLHSSNDGIVHFLANLNSVKKMVLCISEQDIVFSENIRSTCAPPLPNLNHLKVKIKDVHNELKKSDLKDSLSWCAPSVETLEIQEL